jgi:hypothetical protein
MTNRPSYGFDTLQIHAGARPDPATGCTPDTDPSNNSLCIQRRRSLQRHYLIFKKLVSSTLV